MKKRMGGFGGGCAVFVLTVVFFFLFCFFFPSQRSAKLIPEDDQIFTEVELNMLEKVINETTVGGECVNVLRGTYLKCISHNTTQT